MLLKAADPSASRFACDAMCGGLARWLRAIGYDTAFIPDIDDAALIALAARENRAVLSSDTRMFERRVLVCGSVRGLLIPTGLRLLAQLEFVVRRLRLTCGFPRCMLCNGPLSAVQRSEVADRVPARSLLWATEFFECGRCRRVFWNGTHWRRINAVRQWVDEWSRVE